VNDYRTLNKSREDENGQNNIRDNAGFFTLLTLIGCGARRGLLPAESTEFTAGLLSAIQ
jgi:hypothetical protein